MAIQASGKMNWSGLLNYVIQPSDMDLFQNYMTRNPAQYFGNTQTEGVVFGCQISVVAGLQVQVASGAVIMPDGTLIFLPALTATLGAANPSNPRIDRIELSYSLVNNTEVLDVNAVSKTLDILFQPAINVNAGTPASSPSAPTKTSLNVSVGFVRVNAGQTTLISGNISQVVDAGKELSAMRLGDSAGYIRYNDSLSVFQISPDLIVWSSIQSSLLPRQVQSIANAQTAASVSGFILDMAIATSFEVNIEILRSTSGGTVKAFGKLMIYWDTVALAFQIVPQLVGDDVGVTFSSTQIGTSTAYQFNYTSTNLSGTGYTGQIKFAEVNAL